MAEPSNVELAAVYLSEAVGTARADEREFALRLAQIHAILAVSDSIEILTSELTT